MTPRFRARPSGVSFEATGSASPNPCAVSIDGFTPCEIRNWVTVSARFRDRTGLDVMVATACWPRPGAS